MKLYKLPQENITEAKGVFETIDSDSEFVYIRSDKDLKAPFEPIPSLPSSLLNKKREALLLSQTKDIYAINQEASASLKSFTSQALGEEHHYDCDLVDQINLLALVLRGEGGEVRCKKAGEEKCNIPHTKEQIKTLLSDYISHTQKILGVCAKAKMEKQEEVQNALLSFMQGASDGNV